MAALTVSYMQANTYSAQFDRINSLASRFDEGVQNRLSLAVTQRAAGANMTVDVAAGGCIVTGDDMALQGQYNVLFDVVQNVTGFVAPGSNSRYDVIGVQINDVTAGGAAGNNATVVRIAGVVAASPVIPDLSISPGNVKSFLLLAVIGPILPGTTSITNAMIFDAYTLSGAPAGSEAARLVAGFRDRPGTSKDTHCTVADSGWAMEYGQLVLRTDYPALFAEIGTQYNTGGETGTQFRFPDSRGRVTVGLDNMGGADAGVLSTANTLGVKVGVETLVLTAAQMAAHNHSVDPPSTAIAASTTTSTAITDPTHNHTTVSGSYGTPMLFTTPNSLSFSTLAPGDGSGAGYSANSYVVANAATGITASSSSSTSGSVDIAAFNSANNTGTGTALNMMQPSIMINRMIRT